MSQINGIESTASGLDRSVSSAIDEELAALYEHEDHCRRADCLYAKRFYDEIYAPYNPLPSNRIEQSHKFNSEGRVTIRLHIPELQKEATLPHKFTVERVTIRQVLYTPGSTFNPENGKQDDVYFGRGVVIIPSNRADTKCFLTFSPAKNQDDRNSNSPISGKWPDNGIVTIKTAVPEWQTGANQRHEFVGRVSVILYKKWPSAPSEFDGREDFFGRVIATTHSDGADPKCFLAFFSEKSPADRNLHSLAPGFKRNAAIRRKSRSTCRRKSSKRKPYLLEEETLLIHLKEERNLSWKEICKYFPYRKYGSLQAHYAHRLKQK